MTLSTAVHEAQARLRRIKADLAFVDAVLVDAGISPAEAADFIADFGAVQKHSGILCLRTARQAGPGASTLVAGATGTPSGAARKKLATMERVELLPKLRDAVAGGRVSLEQAAVIAPALEAAPSAAPSLLDVAREGSFEELKTTAERTLRQARSEEDQVAKERRLHSQRRCRSWRADDGAVCLEARFAPVDGARVMAVLQKETDTLFRASWNDGIRDTTDRLMADALVGLVSGKAAPAHIVLRVDATALKRGSLENGECCEIDGVGPVSLDAARSLLPEAVMTALVNDGVDILSVTSSTRTIPRRIEVALEERDRCCVVPGCGSTHRLQIDHWRIDFARHGPTELSNLCRICPTHHRLKTKEGWRLWGGPGKWKWVPPD